MQRWMMMRCKHEQLLLAASTVQFILNMFWFLKEVEKQIRKTIDVRPRIEPVPRQNKLESGPFGTLIKKQSKNLAFYIHYLISRKQNTNQQKTIMELCFSWQNKSICQK